MAKIYAPNKEYNGISAGIYFTNGEAETDNPHLIEWFKEKGYEVNGDSEVNADEKPKKKK